MTWYCGGEAATSDYMNHALVRAAMGIPASFPRWQLETDLDWHCSNDDEAAFRHNFTNCEISDYRPMLKQLVVGSGVPVLVFSGDVDAQIPHVATERWTRAMGFEQRAAWRYWRHGAQVGGYSVTYAHNFTFATVKGAGHMVPLHRPAAAQAMVRRFIASQTLGV